LQGGVYFVAAIVFINVVGYATESPSVVLSYLANVIFICGLAVVGVLVLRAIWRAITSAVPRATGLWSSAIANLQSQITLLRLYSRPAASLGGEVQAQESLNPNFDPQ
jgi:cytochrome b561